MDYGRCVVYLFGDKDFFDIFVTNNEIAEKGNRLSNIELEYNATIFT